MLFNIALNYGGRAEIVDAARAARWPRRARSRGRSTSSAFASFLYTAGPARSRSAHPHERRDARQQLPAVADRLRRDLGHRHAVAGLPPPSPARGRRSTIRSASGATGASPPFELALRQEPPLRVATAVLVLPVLAALAFFLGPPAPRAPGSWRGGRPRRPLRVLPLVSGRGPSPCADGLRAGRGHVSPRSPFPGWLRRSDLAPGGARSLADRHPPPGAAISSGACPRRRPPCWGPCYLGALGGTIAALMTLAPPGDGALANPAAPGHHHGVRHVRVLRGARLGRHRLAPSVSPGKTVEGALGGLAGGVVGALAVRHLGLPSLPASHALVLGILVAALGIVGDLDERLLKRWAGVKDSGDALPGPRRDARSPRQLAVRRARSVLLFSLRALNGPLRGPFRFSKADFA